MGSATNYYTILIKDDHTFVHSIKKRIMYRSTGIDVIRFLVEPFYNSLDMTKCNTVVEYVTPCTRTYGVKVIEPSKELYKNRVEFLLPVDLDLTSEIGALELTINFSYLSMNEDGTFTEQVRPIGYTSIPIEDNAKWSDYISDARLDNIAQIMLTNQANVEQNRVNIEKLQEIINDTNNSIRYD